MKLRVVYSVDDISTLYATELHRANKRRKNWNGMEDSEWRALAGHVAYDYWERPLARREYRVHIFHVRKRAQNSIWCDLVIDAHPGPAFTLKEYKIF